MADYYVSALAEGGGAGTELDPWTLAEAVLAINDGPVVGGETVEVLADGRYTLTLVQSPVNLTVEDDRVLLEVEDG